MPKAGMRNPVLLLLISWHLIQGSTDWRAGNSTTPLALGVDPSTGDFWVSVHGDRWLVSSPLVITCNGRLLSSHQGLRTTDRRQFSGWDSLGGYRALAIDWTATEPSDCQPTLNWTTTFAAYTCGRTVTFSQRFNTDVEGFSLAAAAGLAPTSRLWGVPGSGFPAFDASGKARLGSVDGLGYVSYGEIGVPNTGRGRFPAGYKQYDLEEDGVPLMLLDQTTGAAAVLSPTVSFFDSVFGIAGGSSEPELRCGVPGTVERVHAGFETEVVLHAGEPGAAGPTDTMLGWGELLLRKHRKLRSSPTANIQIERLGYSTVGHYFYGLDKGKNAEDSLKAVFSEAAKQGLKLAYVLVDSWWYGEGETPLPDGGTEPGYGGTYRWDDTVARAPHMFPNGLKAFSAAVGVPLVMHMGEWVGRRSRSGPPPYASNASWGWVVEPAASLSVEPAFWDALFRWMADLGLAVYKLDHMQSQMPDMNYTLTQLGVTERWLTNMATAADRYGIAKQYGGHISSAFLHSVQLPNANHARVSADYIPGIKRRPDTCTNKPSDHKLTHLANLLLGANSLYPWAVGIRPYKDAFFSGPQAWQNTTCFVPSSTGPSSGAANTKPEWWGLQEGLPELQVLVSALTAGPIAPGDGIGSIDAALVRRVCREDGLLLKPDRPALAIDPVWFQRTFGEGGPVGEVTHTLTTIDGLRWRYVLGCNLTRAYVVSSADLLSNRQLVETGVAWERRAGQPFGPPVSWIRFDQASPLRLALDAAAVNYTLWRTAPDTCAGRGWRLLGELGKFISVSAQRFKSVTPVCDALDGPGLELEIVGAAGEAVELSLIEPEPSRRLVQKLITIGANGTAKLSI